MSAVWESLYAASNGIRKDRYSAGELLLAAEGIPTAACRTGATAGAYPGRRRTAADSKAAEAAGKTARKAFEEADARLVRGNAWDVSPSADGVAELSQLMSEKRASCRDYNIAKAGRMALLSSAVRMMYAYVKVNGDEANRVDGLNL